MAVAAESVGGLFRIRDWACDGVDLRNGEGGDAFFTADETHGFVGGRLDADAFWGDAEGGADIGAHRIAMGQDFRRFCDEGGIDVDDL